MTSLFKSILATTLLITVGSITAQEVQKQIRIDSKTAVQVPTNSSIKRVETVDNTVKERTPKKRVMNTKTSEVTMPEKTDKVSKQWRKDGLKKRKAVAKTDKVNTTTYHYKGDDASQREFGTYKAWNKRAAVKNDEEWNRLNEMITNKVNNPNQSRAIIKNKRVELKSDFENNKINKEEYKSLSQDLDYAEEDLNKIETWVGGKK